MHGSWSLTTVMAARTFFLPGIILLFCAFILSLLVAVSLPALPALDIVRCHFPSGLTLDVSSIPMIKEIRVNTLLLPIPYLAEFCFVLHFHLCSQLGIW